MIIPIRDICSLWFPKHKATVMGILTMGNGGSLLIFGVIQVLVVNPDNVKTDPVSGYYTDQMLLDKVPGKRKIRSNYRM